MKHSSAETIIFLRRQWESDLHIVGSSHQLLTQLGSHWENSGMREVQKPTENSIKVCISLYDIPHRQTCRHTSGLNEVDEIAL